ncbi:MAG: MFS transporter [Candidatus Gracilibacteria bacterium]|nr:MFS transporter [Candidatus Gracilibacteria bacterium]
MERLKKVKTDYFEDKNYLILYSFNFLYNFASSIVTFFTGAFFYSLGMPLHFILLFFGLEFGLRGILSPLGPSLATKLGVTKAIILANIAYVLYFVFIGLSEVSLALGFSAFIFHSFARGLQLPIVEGLQSKLINNHNRGKQQSLMLILKSTAGLVGIAFGSYVLDSLSYNVIVISVSIALFLSTIPFLFLKDFSFGENYNYKDSYKYLVGDEFRDNLLPLSGFALTIIAHISFIPLFIYSRVQDFSSFGIIMFIIFFAKALFLFLFGRLVDKKGSEKVNKSTGLLNQIGNLSLMIFIANPFSLTLANIYTQITRDLFFSSSQVRQYNKAKKLSFLFMTGVQMILCFVEIIALSLFALLAFFIGDNIFYIIFLSSILGSYLFSYFFKD